MFYEIRNIKPCYQGLILRFSCNDPKQRYYLNGTWTCGLSVLILFQKVALCTGLLSPRGFRIKILIVEDSNCNNHSKQFQQNQGIPKFRDAWLWTLDFRHWSLDAGLWTLVAGCYTLGTGLWALDTIVDCFRIKSEANFLFCLIKLLKILWVWISKDLMVTLVL